MAHPTPADALELALKLHEGQFDKAGKPYSVHILGAIAALEEHFPNASPRAKILTALHDSVEDRRTCFEELEKLGYGRDISKGLFYLGKPELEPLSYTAFIERLCTADVPLDLKLDILQAKIADNRDNRREERLALIQSSLKRRELRWKYDAAFSRLFAEVAITKMLLAGAPITEQEISVMRRASHARWQSVPYAIPDEYLADAFIAVDMDGVLADFDDEARRLGLLPSGVDLNKSGEHLDADSKALKRRLYDGIQGTDFFRNLKPMPGARSLWEAISGADPIILTAAPKFGVGETGEAFQRAARDKAWWVGAWLESLSDASGRFVCTTSAKKPQFMRSTEKKRDARHAILIDDRERNCQDWERAGGTAVHFKDARQAIIEVGRIVGWDVLNDRPMAEAPADHDPEEVLEDYASDSHEP